MRRTRSVGRIMPGVNFTIASREGATGVASGVHRASFRVEKLTWAWRREGERRGYTRSIKPPTLSPRPFDGTCDVDEEREGGRELAARKGAEKGGGRHRKAGAGVAGEEGGRQRRRPGGVVRGCIQSIPSYLIDPSLRTSSHPRGRPRNPRRETRPRIASTMASGITRETSFATRNGHVSSSGSEWVKGLVIHNRDVESEKYTHVIFSKISQQKSIKIYFNSLKFFTILKITI